MNDYNLKTGTTVGTLLSIVSSVNTASLLDTVILAAVGASVSFGVSMIWKYFCNKNHDH